MLNEAQWILGRQGPLPDEETMKKRLEHAVNRYTSLMRNLQQLGGHSAKVVFSVPGISTAINKSGLRCLLCGKTAAEAGCKGLQICSNCKSPAIAHCSKECFAKDYRGPFGIHGIKSERREGKMTECEMIKSAMAEYEM